MRLASPLSLVLALAVSPSFALGAPPADASGCKDHPLFTRMPGYLIYRCIEKQFDAFKFKTGEPRKPKVESIEGRFVQIIYHFDKSAGGAPPSRLQVIRNYQNAVKQIGGEVLLDDAGETTLKVVQKGNEIWARASEYGTAVTLEIIERQAMKQDVVASADVWANDLKATGHAAVYGIYFDTGSSVVKPESQPALQEIAKLLSADAALKLWVVGHTDAVGTLESNLKLSQTRAEAVRTALTSQHGVAPARLVSQGVGPLAPLATNTTDEGRAKNRRVELVAQ